MDNNTVSALFSHITSTAIVIYTIQWLRSIPRVQRFIAALPIEDKNIHRLLSLFGAAISSVGIHIAFKGNMVEGWQIGFSIPPLLTMAHMMWDLLNQFALNQLAYDTVLNKVEPPVYTTLLDRTAPIGTMPSSIVSRS